MIRRTAAGKVVMLLAALVFVVCGALGVSLNRAYASQGTYAMLYSDGTLVLQDGAEADLSKGELTATYGPVTDGLSAILGDAVLMVKSVEFADPFSMFGDVSGFFSGMSSCESIIGFDKVDTSEATSVYLMFSNCSSLVSLDLSGLDLSGLAEEGPGGTFHMFSGCSSLESLDLSGWDTSAVTNMSGMFSGCSSLVSLDLSGFDVSNVSGDKANGGGMSTMFNGCSSLEALDLSGWNTSNVTSMFHMFTGCSSLGSLDLSSFDTSSVTDMSGMFTGCSSLGSLDLSSFDTSAVEYMGGSGRYGNDGMFEGCSSLESLDLSSFDTSSVQELHRTFVGCSLLRKISLGAGFVFKELDGVLPTPNSELIPGADGRWYATSGASYVPSDVPSGRADTYYAVASEVPGYRPVERIAGDYATETSALVSREAFPDGSGWVVVARDDDFADAMSAAGLAGTLRCPILLTGGGGLSSAAAQEVARLGASKAYVVGGPGAMPGDFEGELAALGCGSVSRVYGEYAWDTSVECARLIAEHGGNERGDAVVALGSNFQDALSVSPFAYAYGVPILLTQPWDGFGLTAEAQEVVRGLPGAVWVPGGPGAVPESAVEGAFPGREVVRMYGEDGYDTSNQIARRMASEGLLSADTCVVASGARFAKGSDALSGAALAGLAGGPLLLVNGNAAEPGDLTAVEGVDSRGDAAFLSERGGEVGSCYALGGEFVMPRWVVARIEAAIMG